MNTRKRIRLKGHDYRNGAYFVTVCTHKRRNLLGRVVIDDNSPALSHDIWHDRIVGATAPGRPLSVPPQSFAIEHNNTRVVLSALGKCVDETIQKMNENNNNVKIKKYIIMPNHIHMIVIIKSNDIAESNTGDRGRSPLRNVVRSIKSFVSKRVGYSIWQKSFYDHIIRNKIDYDRTVEYINNNPIMWYAHSQEKERSGCTY